MTMQPHATTTGTALPDLDQLKGMNVYDLNDEKIGSVEGVYVDGDDRTPGTVRYLAVESGWFGTKRHIIPLDDVHVTDRGDALVVPYGRDHLETAPTYDDRDQISADDEDQIYGHYGRTGYWEAVHARQTTPAPTPEIARAEAADDLARGRDGRRSNEPDDRLTVAERQSTPAPTPEIAEAAIADEMTRGAVDSDRAVAGDGRIETADRNITDRDAQYDRPGVRRYEW